MVDNLAEAVIKTIINLVEKTVSPFKGLVMTLFDFCFSKMEGLASVFENPILNAFLYVVNMFSWTVFVFALLFYFLKIAQEEQRNWAVIMRCPVNAIIFITLNQIIAQLCFVLPYHIIRGIQTAFALDIFDSGSFLDVYFSEAVKPLIFTICAIAIIGFFIVTVMRIGSMSIQMMIAPFYVPYALMGENQRVMEWVVSTVSIGFTYVIQFAMFYIGALILTYAKADIVNGVMGIAFLFSVFAVPKGMQKFGWSSGAGHGFQSAAMGGNMLISGARALTMKG
ncbi:MAG: hypothetical protein RR639_08395 [Hydrogenoanaerobacterium sp.]